MSLYVLQNTLLTIYTDQEYQKEFFNNTNKVLGALDITEKEKKALLSLPKNEVADFSNELVEKRLAISRKITKNWAFGGEPPVFLFPSFRSGPALFFLERNTEHEITLTHGANAFLLKIVRGESKKLTLSNLVKVFLSTTSNSKARYSIRDVFLVARVVQRYNLGDRNLRGLL